MDSGLRGAVRTGGTEGSSGQEGQHVRRRGGARDPGQQPPSPPSLSPLPLSLRTDASRVGQGPPWQATWLYVVHCGGQPACRESHLHFRAPSLRTSQKERRCHCTFNVFLSDICHSLPPPPALKKGRLSGFVETFYVLIVGVVKRGWYIIWQNSSSTTVQICMYKLHLNKKKNF